MYFVTVYIAGMKVWNFRQKKITTSLLQILSQIMCKLIVAKSQLQSESVL